MSIHQFIAEDQKTLSQADIESLVEKSLPDLKPEGKRLLLIIPDNTRTVPFNMVFTAINKVLKPHVEKLDFLIALGTHAPMSQEEIFKFLELDQNRLDTEFSKTEIFNHLWNDPDHLAEIGEVSQEKMLELSKGKMDVSVKVTINKKIFDYDQAVIVGPTFPHEVVGFSGGHKYLFPGIAGQKVIDAFHWLGALITNREIIGTLSTPVRDVVDYCASLVKTPLYCYSMVTTKKGVHGIYGGLPSDTYKAAAKQSSTIHIKWFEKPFNTVLSICPTMYPELWTAGKCMYKLEPVVAKGGKLIIYAPHLSEISVSHGEHIKEIGYHTLPYFQAQFEKFTHIPWGVIAHSTHVKGTGIYENGVETPNVNVYLASQVPESVCKQINLGYIDPKTINISDYENKEDEGILCVHQAGEVLHKLTESNL